MTVQRPTNRIRQLLIMVITIMAVRALFGDEIGAFMDGMVIGFTDDI